MNDAYRFLSVRPSHKVYNVVFRLFSKVWKIKFSNIHLMAILVNGLSRYHSDFSIAVVDSVVETIKVGLDQNNFRHNQKRIAVVRFLGELYNYRMVDSPLIFSTLDTLISTGHGKIIYAAPAPRGKAFGMYFKKLMP